MKGFFKEFCKILWKKTNTWNIRRLVDESFVPSAQRTSVLYCRLTDFYTVYRKNFDVYSNYLFYLFQFRPILFPFYKFVIEKRTFENSFAGNTHVHSLHSLNYFAAALAASSGFTTAWPSFSGKKLSKWRTAAVLSGGL